MKGEATLVAETIEDGPAFREGADGGVVVELIEVDAGLLSLHQVDLLDEAVDREGDRSIPGAGEESGARLKALGLADGGVVALDHGNLAEDPDEGRDDELAPTVHREGEGLEHKMIAVAVDHDPREPVGLAPDETVNRLGKGLGFTQDKGAAETAVEKVGIELLLAARDAAGHDLRLGIVNRGAEGTVAEVLQRNHVARLRVSKSLLHLRRVDPVVAVKNA